MAYTMFSPNNSQFEVRDTNVVLSAVQLNLGLVGKHKDKRLQVKQEVHQFFHFIVF